MTTPQTAITINAPYNAAELAVLQGAAEQDLRGLTTLPPCTDPVTYQALDEMLTMQLRRVDAADKAKAALTVPIRQGLKAIDDLFRPLVAPLDAGVSVLKRLMRDYQTALAAAEREARALALKAAVAGQDALMQHALTVAADAGAAQRVDVGSQARWKWEVTGIVHELVPPAYQVVDEKKIAAIARAWPGSRWTPPEIAGVTFARVPQIAGRH